MSKKISNFVPLMLFLLIFNTFIQSCDPSGNENVTLMETQWVLKQAAGEQIDIEPAPYIRFSNEENKINGFAGCNSFFGSYEIKKDKIKFGPLGATRMICPESDFEDRFFTLLNRCDRFRIEASSLILNSNGEDLLVFHPDPDAEK